MPAKKFFLSMLFGVWIFNIASSQGSISMKLSSDTIFIGDQIQVDYIVRVPKGNSDAVLNFGSIDSTRNLAFSEQNPNLDEFLDWEHISFQPSLKFNIDKKLELKEIQHSEDGKNFVFNFSQSLSIFSLGVFDIEAPEITSSKPVVLMPLQRPRLFVKVPNTLATKDSLVIRPIKPIIETAFALEDLLVYVYTLLGALLLAYVFYRLGKKKLKHPEETEETLKQEIKLPHESALEKLELLKSEELWQKGRVKEYQSTLTDIIREYLEGRFDIRALEMTTDEISRSLKNTNFDINQESKLKEILQMADLIKFAKAKPDESIHEQYFNTAVDFVLDTKEEVIKEVEE